MKSCTIQSPIGNITITGNSSGIASVSIASGNPAVSTSPAVPKSLSRCVTQLHEYFAGERQIFDLKLNPEGTDFQKRVWNLLLTVPYGKTISYLELSKLLGDVKAIRAVAGANGKNPICIIIPCHRIIGSDGSLTGYAGGISRKKWLLNHESPHKQHTLF
ncbi:MAG TPA: methylated-DNA--[protein]-cysteine S-methyltransferase [Flavobacteriaceae bacterium]|nr:methylated-DNA--[protein]-cysteine S-methyltransferase [Flavobacteriaceae bacterium]